MQNVLDFSINLRGMWQPHVAGFGGSAGAAGYGPWACALHRLPRCTELRDLFQRRQDIPTADCWVRLTMAVRTSLRLSACPCQRRTPQNVAGQEKGGLSYSDTSRFWRTMDTLWSWPRGHCYLADLSGRVPITGSTQASLDHTASL